MLRGPLQAACRRQYCTRHERMGPHGEVVAYDEVHDDGRGRCMQEAGGRRDRTPLIQQRISGGENAFRPRSAKEIRGSLPSPASSPPNRPAFWRG